MNIDWDAKLRALVAQHGLNYTLGQRTEDGVLFFHPMLGTFRVPGVNVFGEPATAQDISLALMRWLAEHGIVPGHPDD